MRARQVFAALLDTWYPNIDTNIEIMPRHRFHNALTRSEHHDAIMAKFNEIERTAGAVALKPFHAEVVAPLLPHYKYNDFCIYIRKLRTAAAEDPEGTTALIPTSPAAALAIGTMHSAAENTKKGIDFALQIGRDALEKIATGETKLTEKEKADLMFKAMKAQDSRIQATAKVRQDQRSQVAFDHVFGDAAYTDENA
jgi:hypothetical protein